jgi:hypothetical protein
MADEMRYDAVQSGALEDGAIVAGGVAARGMHLNSGGGYRDTVARPQGTDETFANVQDLRPAPAVLLPSETTASRSSASSTGHGLAADLITFAGGIGLGAAVMYFMDPERGRRRRALVRDQVAHFAATVPPGAGAARRDLANRSRGLVASLKGSFGEDDASDETIVARVRSELGRVVSHPGSIIVTANAGTVTLSGPVLESEAEPLLKAVAGTRGVKEVHSQLEVHDEIASMSVPGLQGGIERMGASNPLAERWTPAARVVAGAAGATLAVLAGRRRDAIGTAVGLLGLGLTARAVTNLPLERHAMELADRASGPVRDRVGPLAESVRDGASSLGERVGESMRPLGERVSDGAGMLAQRVEQLADTMTHRFTDFADAARERLPEGMRERLGGSPADTPAEVARAEGTADAPPVDGIDRSAANPYPQPNPERELGA